MKEKILKSKTQFIVTFAAIALMGFGLILVAVPVSADDGTQHPHFLGKPFGKQQHIENQQQRRSEVITGFLGISEDELRTRVENGDTIHEIAVELGKTRKDFHAYILDYMKEHRLHDQV